LSNLGQADGFSRTSLEGVVTCSNQAGGTSVIKWTTVAGVVFVAAAAVAGVAVSGQARDVVTNQTRDAAAKKGEPEPQRMTVANKATEPVPVSAVLTGVGENVRLELTQDTIANLKDNVVVRMAPVQWEYRELRLPTAPINYQSILGQLRQAGAEGWETTGVQFSDAGATVVILKKAKPS
jgi:hypothetical protein